MSARREQERFPIASPPRVSSDRIDFQVDRLDTRASGVIELGGRWYGVRGRRFVRPELILHEAGGERRLLAELDEKPWAAQDGELWRATFPGDAGFDTARAVELSVAPDIIVALRGRPPARTPASTRRRPRIPLDVPRPAPTAGGATGEATAPAAAAARGSAAAGPGTVDAADTRPAAPGDAGETSRLRARVNELESGLQRERTRREAAEQALERQRAETRELSTELGRVRADVALSQAAEREARATSELLDSSRHEQHAAQSRYDALAAEHERALRTQSTLREELAQRSAELGTARAALDAARTERAAARAGRAERAESEGAAPAPAWTPRERETDASGDAFAPFTPHGDRPLNPSLRSNSWSLRLLAVIVLAAVVIAVIVILTSTVLH